jgi:hypothetical protein
MHRANAACDPVERYSAKEGGCRMTLMTGRRVWVGAAWVLSAGLASQGQVLNPPPRDVIVQSRALIDAEVAAVLEAARHAVEGRTFRLSYTPGGPGADIQMGAGGRPRYIRMLSGQEGHAETVTFLHYTGTAAPGCDGMPRTRELVLEYEHKGSTWTVKARTRSGVELNNPAFEMLVGHQALASGPVGRLGDRRLRALVAPFQRPEGALGGPPLGTLMSLWLDTDSLLPVRWSLTLPASAERGIPVGVADFEVWFTYLDPVQARLRLGV